MDRYDLLELFDGLIADVADALSDLEDWGPSGLRATQYNHDVVADEVLVGGLLEAGLSVLSEESGLVAASTGSSVVVVVDPVDGSTNASRALPWYATSICAVDQEGPLVAEVVNLATGDRFRAIRGEGVESDEVEVGPSGCTELSDAIVAFSGLPPDHGGWRQFRAYGAAALDLCAVATGTFDGFVDVDDAHGVWDYLGALLVCREAGVPVVDREGRELVTLDPAQRRGPIAAATWELLGELQAMDRRWRAEQGAGRAR
ncbi:MAG: inositol monophosphatase family protein [Actinomycetota bacterium]